MAARFSMAYTCCITIAYSNPIAVGCNTFST